MNVLHPTVVMGLGSFGGRVTQYVRDRLGTGEQLAICDAPFNQTGPLLEKAAGPLLIAGRSGAAGALHLDVVAVCMAMDDEDSSSLLEACRQATDLVAGRYGALFSRHQGERGATLHLVVVTPPLRTPAGEEALRRLWPVQQWRTDPATFPLLAKVWILSASTRGGLLTPEDVVRSCGAFTIGLFGAGVRAETTIASRVEHQSGGLFGFFAAASVDLPRCRLRRYASVGAVHEGMATLVGRVEQAADNAMARQRVAALGSEGWVQPFTQDGVIGQRCLQVAGRMSGGDRSLPDTVVVRPLDEVEQVRERYPVLFQRATLAAQENRADQEALNALIEDLDCEESRVFAQIESGLATVFARELSAADGLKNLPVVHAGLRLIRDELEDAANRDAQETDSTPAEEDPQREQVEQALAALPRRRAIVAQAIAVGSVVWFAIIALTMGALGDDRNPAEVVQVMKAAWVIGLVIGALSAGGLTWWLGRNSRDALRWALQHRRDAVRDLWDRGGGGAPGRQGHAQLRQRRLRVRRGAVVALDQGLEQLDAVRSTLMEARDRALARLAHISGRHEARADVQDIEHLLGDPTTFHAPLLGARETSTWLRGERSIREPENWASRLLEASWPGPGLLADVPCADDQQLARLGRDQTAPLASSRLFDDPTRADSAASRVAEFARRVPANLERPVTPLHEDESPCLGDGHEQVFVVAPTSARHALEKALTDGQLANLPVIWGQGGDERVLFLRTWQGYTLHDIVRGLKAGTS